MVVVQSLHDFLNENINYLKENGLYNEIDSIEGANGPEIKIDGKTYNVKEDLYDVVPKDKSKYELKISGKNYLSVKYNRQFTKGEHIPSVKVEPKFNFLSVSFQITLAIAGIILVSVIVIIAVKLYIKNYNKN